MTSIKNLPKGAKVAPVRFLKYSPSTTVCSKQIRKLLKFKMADGPHFKNVFDHNSATDCPILVKCYVSFHRISTMGEIYPRTAFHRTNFSVFLMQFGR